jgi:N-acetylglucosamine kinase-like BadF-type ATPase
MAPTILVAIDAGGTKTECVALRVEDGVATRAVGSGSNYQGTGIVAAQNTWNRLARICCEQLGAAAADVVAAGLGIAGLDRPKDRATIEAAFATIWPHRPALELVNDADLALRAGAPGGVGVAVVSGTGCNAMGMAADGGRFRVGGIGPEFGDLGSASDIGIEALRGAFRSQDDRGPATSLVPMIMARLQLKRLDDLVDFFLADQEEDGDDGEFDSGKLAPLVFEAAGQGDAVSIGILEWAGRELGLSARAVARNLFATADTFPLVLGGSVLQKGATDHLMAALLADVRAEFPNVSPVVLDVPPVAGALLLARDRYVALPGNRELLTPAAALESLRGLI